MSHMVASRVSYGEVLEVLSSTTTMRSTMGIALERCQAGVEGAVDYVRAQERAEEVLLRRAAAYTCLDELRAFEVVRFIPCKDLKVFAKSAELPEGAAAVALLRAFAPWATAWPEKALAATYQYALGKDERVRYGIAQSDNLAQRFREGKHPRARKLAALLVADAELVVSGWVDRWNRKRTEGMDAQALAA